MRIPLMNSSITLPCLIFVMLSCIGCANLPFRGYLPFQWGKVITPLTSEDLHYFNNRFNLSGDRPVMLNESESNRMLTKLRGPVSDDFGEESFESTVWLYIDRGVLQFYRFRKHSEGYSMVEFQANGQFYSSGGGREIPSNLKQPNSNDQTAP